QRNLAGLVIWSPYVQREYISGVASDKAPRAKLKNPTYAAQLAQVLGRAAATNIIIGRATTDHHPIFDDGDELLVVDALGQIVDVVVADPTGSFTNYEQELEADAPAYADPILDRTPFLPNVQAFTEHYLEAFVARFQHIQSSYHRHRKAFDGLFRHRRRDPAGNLAHRWATVLTRLEHTDPERLAQLIRDAARA
ncbi:MAG: hypothetical protein IT440_06630, partial [Phycisphaeraceae bacterium]|nr:hypothetical protein [Phycisphaeraceae bacterium]